MIEKEPFYMDGGKVMLFCMMVAILFVNGLSITAITFIDSGPQGALIFGMVMTVMGLAGFPVARYFGKKKREYLKGTLPLSSASASSETERERQN